MTVSLIQLPDGSKTKEFGLNFDSAETFESGLYRTFRPLPSGYITWTCNGVTERCHFSTLGTPETIADGVCYTPHYDALPDLVSLVFPVS